MTPPFTRYEDSDEEEGQGDKENNAKTNNANTAKETVEEKMEKMFNEEEKEESKENDGGSEVFPIFRYCKVITEPRLNRLKCPFSR